MKKIAFILICLLSVSCMTVKIIKQGIDQLDKAKQIASDQYELCKRIKEIKI